MRRTSRLPTTCALAFVVFAVLPAPVSAQNLPDLFFSTGSHASVWSEWARGAPSGTRAVVRRAMFAYELVAYVAKEVLDDASYEYRESPIGSFLARQEPAEHSRLELPAIPGAVAAEDPPPNLDYAVRRVALRDLWLGLNGGGTPSPNAFSLDPKVGAGKAGVIFTFRW